MFCNSFVGDDLYIFYLQVEFLGEDGSDTGGLRCEFFTLAFKEFSFKYLEGRGSFKHNAVAYQVIAVDYVCII